MLLSGMAPLPSHPGLRNLSLKTKLLLMMLSLLLLSVSSLFLLHLYSERRLISQLRDYTEDLSTAIEVFQEQPGAVEGGVDPPVALKQYAEKLRQLGVKDVSITDTSDEVQASTDPQNVGKRVQRTTKKKGPKEYVISGVLGEENRGVGSKTSTLTIPIVAGDQRIGTLLITRTLEDFSVLSQEAFLSRLLATLGVFALGILLSLYLSWSLIRPLHGLTQAAQQVAAGDMAVHVSPAASTRWWSGCASTAPWRRGCTSPSAPPRWDGWPRRWRTRSGTPSTSSTSPSTTCASGWRRRRRRSGRTSTAS